MISVLRHQRFAALQPSLKGTGESVLSDLMGTATCQTLGVGRAWQSFSFKYNCEKSFSWGARFDKCGGTRTKKKGEVVEDNDGRLPFLFSPGWTCCC